MTPAQLRDYRNWLRLSARDVLMEVIGVGGWEQVFKDGVPRWASKVRNYFNETPKRLTGLDAKLSEWWLAKGQKFIRSEKKMNEGKTPIPLNDPARIPKLIVRDAKLYAVLKALSGDVYSDEHNRIWYQMSPGGTVYHLEEARFEKIVAPPLFIKEIDAGWATIKGQSFIPIFKLVSLDDSGGSRECIIENPTLIRYQTPLGPSVNVRASGVAAEGRTVDVSHRIVTHFVLQGSYNYSETIDMGLNAHEMRDVRPHSTDPMFYSNPELRFSPLRLRQFPVNDNAGRPLADQKQID